MDVNETGEIKTTDDPGSELGERIWAVVSSERCEAADLTYPEADIKLAELKARRIHGLTIVTVAAAERINS